MFKHWHFGSAVLLGLSGYLYAQGADIGSRISTYVSSPARTLVAPELPEMNDEWASNSLSWANVMLDGFKPDINERPERRPVLQRLDDIFHMQSAASRPSVRAFLRTRIDTALLEMESGTPAAGKAQVWKIYNAGFVVRSEGITIGFDLVPGPPGSDVCSMTDEQMKRLVAQVDILFITHAHYDHASPRIAELFLKAGKPVAGPPGLWLGRSFETPLTYPERNPNRLGTFAVRGKNIQVAVYPGHQGAVLNNVYFVQFPSGLSVLHTGDQDQPGSDAPDRSWLNRIGSQHHVDVLLVDCWYAHFNELVESIRPAIVIPGHENELAHSVSQRQGFDRTYEELAHSPKPVVLMTWGESITLTVSSPPPSSTGALPPASRLSPSM